MWGLNQRKCWFDQQTWGFTWFYQQKLWLSQQKHGCHLLKLHLGTCSKAPRFSCVTGKHGYSWADPSRFEVSILTTVCGWRRTWTWKAASCKRCRTASKGHPCARDQCSMIFWNCNSPSIHQSTSRYRPKWGNSNIKSQWLSIRSGLPHHWRPCDSSLWLGDFGPKRSASLGSPEVARGRQESGTQQGRLFQFFGPSEFTNDEHLVICLKTSSAKLLAVFDPPFLWSCIPRQALLGGHAPPSIVQLRWRFKSFLHWLTFGEGQTSDLGGCWALRQAFWVPIRQRKLCNNSPWLDILE